MAQTTSKFIKFGTGSGEVNSRDLPANFTPSNYTPVAVGSEGTDKVSSNLKGIDNALGSIVPAVGDISPTVWNGLANNTADQTITGFAFSNATVRSFTSIISFNIGATSALNAQYTINGIQRTSDWVITVDYVGDSVPGLSFSITTSGQVKVSVGNISGFSSAKVVFRASCTQT